MNYITDVNTLLSAFQIDSTLPDPASYKEGRHYERPSPALSRRSRWLNPAEFCQSQTYSKERFRREYFVTSQGTQVWFWVKEGGE